jgi:hypothetical protein
MDDQSLVWLRRSSCLALWLCLPGALAVSAEKNLASQLAAQPTTADSAARELDTILTRWTTAAAAVQTLECRFVRQEFDSEHHRETRGYGRIHFEADGRAMYALEPYPLQARTRSTRATPRGQPYELEASKAETLYWISGQVARINTTAREYELFEVPEPFWSPGIVEATESFDVLWTTLGCLERHVPGLLEDDLPQLRQRFEWSLLARDESQIVLTARPLTPAEQRHYSVLHVYIDPQTWLTKGTRETDSTGTRETVHSFSEMKANLARPSSTPDWAPHIGQMKLLTPPPLAPPADE